MFRDKHKKTTTFLCTTNKSQHLRNVNTFPLFIEQLFFFVRLASFLHYFKTKYPAKDIIPHYLCRGRTVCCHVSPRDVTKCLQTRKVLNKLRCRQCWESLLEICQCLYKTVNLLYTCIHIFVCIFIYVNKNVTFKIFKLYFNKHSNDNNNVEMERTHNALVIHIHISLPCLEW